MGWRGGNNDIPLDIEVVDESGRVIAGGSDSALDTADHAAAEPEPRTPRRVRWPLVGLVAAVALAAIVAAALWPGDDGSTAAPLPDAVGVLTEAVEVDLSDVRDVATFPLFDREWDVELIGTDNQRLVALDLNTGEMRDLGRPDDRGGFDFISAARVVDDAIFSMTFNGVHRHFDGTAERISPALSDREEERNQGFGAIGNYWFQATPPSERTLTHLVTGREVEFDGIVDFTAIGDDVFVQAGGSVIRIGPDGESATWANGELLAVGTTRIAWRRCDNVDDCRYWLGTPDDPNGTELDVEIAENALIPDISGAGFGPGLFTSIELLSPSGRYAWDLEQDDEFGFSIALVDLVTGEELAFDQFFGSLPALDPDEALLIARAEDSPRLAAVDTATGEALLLPSPFDAAGASFAFAPTE